MSISNWNLNNIMYFYAPAEKLPILNESFWALSELCRLLPSVCSMCDCPHVRDTVSSLSAYRSSEQLFLFYACCHTYSTQFVYSDYDCLHIHVFFFIKMIDVFLLSFLYLQIKDMNNNNNRQSFSLYISMLGVHVLLAVVSAQQLVAAGSAHQAAQLVAAWPAHAADISTTEECPGLLE